MTAVRLGSSRVWVQGKYSLSLVIPKVVAENLKLRPGDVVVFKLKDGMIVLEKEVNEE